MAGIQRRRGPNLVGLWGLLQPLADGLKLFSKEVLIPWNSNRKIFLYAPIVILTLSLLAWAVVPFGLYEQTEIILYHFYTNQTLLNSNNNPWKWITHFSILADIRAILLFLLAISSLNVYGIICAGWASHSKYAFLGALRAAAQMIAYEVSIGLTLLPTVALAGSFNFAEIVAEQEKTIWFIIPLLPCAIIFFISMLAETNRAPFDLVEAEAELVAGYNVEYSSMTFAMFFLAEYCNMILMSTILVTLFLGGWLAPLKCLTIAIIPFWFCIKIIIVCFLIVLTRAALPRYRYDQLMMLGWKQLLPITFGYFFLIMGILTVLEITPIQ